MNNLTVNLMPIINGLIFWSIMSLKLYKNPVL